MNATTIDHQALRSARKSAAAAMPAAFPHLVAVSDKVDGLQAAAKNMRIELKAAWPKVKFSVKSSRYSGGDSIRVNWIDGPTADEVDEIVGKYKGGSFDGMTDSYHYERGAWTDAFGDTSYVFTTRDNSDKAIESAIRYVFGYWADLSGLPVPTVADYFAGRTPSIMVGNQWVDSLIRQAAARRVWALRAKAAK